MLYGVFALKLVRNFVLQLSFKSLKLRFLSRQSGNGVLYGVSADGLRRGHAAVHERWCVRQFVFQISSKMDLKSVGKPTFYEVLLFTYRGALNHLG